MSLVENLRSLRQSEIDLILVGGLAAVVQGAPIQTYDVDVVYSKDPANLARLINCLETLDAVYRFPPERRLRPALNHLGGKGHLNLMTKYGPLDVLGTIGPGLGYDELLPKTEELDLGDGLFVRVLNLETIIQLKEQLGGEKDMAALPILRRTLELKRRL